MGPAPLSVSAFLAQINALLETQVAWVEGEVADVRPWQGKYLYFDLKDEAALVHCFGLVFRLRAPLEDGMRVRIWGVPRVYPRYGKFSLLVERLEPWGEGALRRTFELLRRRLEAEGLFEPARKRALPRFPEHLVLVTSADAAAYRDVLSVLQGRRGGLEILFLPVPVQGEGAPEAIAGAIDWASENAPTFDALLLVRGGGSLADLHAFNDERVVRSLARSRLPTVVGVGHERDVTLADLVADVRAATPSHAAEVATPTAAVLDAAVRDLAARLVRAAEEHLRSRESLVARHVLVLRETIAGVLDRVLFLTRRMEGVGHVLRERLHGTERALHDRTAFLHRRVADVLAAGRERLLGLDRLLHGLAPAQVLERGYSITRGPRGVIVKDAGAVQRGDPLTTRVARGTIHSVTVTASHGETPRQLHPRV